MSLAVGILVCLLIPGSHRLVTRLLFGWDALIAVYLVLVYAMMLCNDHQHIRRAAAMQDDGRFVILLVTAIGAFASIAAIVSELGTPHRGVLELSIAITTIVLSWAAVHTIFALHYAHDYYRHATPGGLQFPSGDKEDHADYWGLRLFLVRDRHDRAGLRRRHLRQDHPPHRDRARHRLIHLQYGLAGADGQHRGERDLDVVVVLAKARTHCHRPWFCEDWWLAPRRRNFSLG
ncbi:hypothetical protein ACVWWO_005005 [Bradyrhizobium sp. F1.13.1]